MAVDGNDTITGLRWRGWGRRTARATGTNHINNCRPSCANGDVRLVRTTVTLSRPGFYHGFYVYKCYALTPGRGYLRHTCLYG